MEKNIMTKCNLLVIGGSAGSLEIIINILFNLKTDLQFPVIIVLHRKNNADSILTQLLSSKTTLHVKEADEKDLLQPGSIYIAPADYHLLVEKNHTLSLDFSEKVNFSRPGIDVTFQTAADVFGDSLACLLLSGASSDGTEGLKMVKSRGGLTVVQNPLTAEVSYMPQQAIAGVDIDVVVDAGNIPAFINAL
jgi:two-component system chemotaxis response regulator CheB